MQIPPGSRFQPNQSQHQEGQSAEPHLSTPGLRSSTPSSAGLSDRTLQARTPKKEPHYHQVDNQHPLFKPFRDIRREHQPLPELSVNWIQLSPSPEEARRNHIEAQIREYFSLSDTGRAQWLQSRMLESVSDGDVFPELKGANEVRANRTIEPFELLGHYAGELHDDKTQETLFAEYSQDKVAEYSVGVFVEVPDGHLENYVISGYPESNLCSLINAHYTYAPELEESGVITSFRNPKNVKVNVETVSATKGEKVYVLLYSTERINKGNILWMDYGQEYWQRLNESRIVDDNDEDEPKAPSSMTAGSAGHTDTPFFPSDSEESDMGTDTYSSTSFQLGMNTESAVAQEETPAPGNTGQPCFQQISEQALLILLKSSQYHRDSEKEPGIARNPLPPLNRPEKAQVL